MTLPYYVSYLGLCFDDVLSAYERSGNPVNPSDSEGFDSSRVIRLALKPSESEGFRPLFTLREMYL